MKISIFGLGYVGAVSSACFASQGHDVIGVDVSPEKVKLINSGKSPIVEEGLEELIAKAIKSKKLKATNQVQEAILSSEVSIICVGTPSKSNGSIDLSFIYKVCAEIAGALKKKKSFHTVVIRSTVSPGTLKECSSIISKASGKKLNTGFGLASNPEFLREGTAVKDFSEPPYTIIGATCTQSEEVLKKLYEKIKAPFYSLKPEESEMIKYANNNFHAVKISFANELGNICKELGIDGSKVMEIVAKDTKLNLSSYYMKPGFAFGGSCLPKDVRGLTYKSRQLDLKTPLLNSLIESNEYQVQRALQLVAATGKKKIGILGFAFKAGTDDLRESPMVTLVETLMGKGYKISIYDENVMLSKLLGKNKQYIEQHIPHITELMKKNMREVIRQSEVIIIGNNSPEFKMIFEMVSPSQTILDLVRIDKARTSSGNYVGICW